MYNYQEDIKKSLGEISEKLNVEPKNRPAAYNIHEEIANTLHDISEKVSEGGGSGGGPGYEVVPTTETVLFDGDIFKNEHGTATIYEDMSTFPDDWSGIIDVTMTIDGVTHSDRVDINQYDMPLFNFGDDLYYFYPDAVNNLVTVASDDGELPDGWSANLQVSKITERHVVPTEDFTDAVSAAIGPVEDKSPVVIREYDLDNSIVIIPEGGGDNYVYPTFLDFQGYIASGRPIIYRTGGSGDAITYNVNPVQSLLRQAYDPACYLVLNDQSNTGGYIQKIIYRADDQSSPFVRSSSYTFSGTSDS